MLSILLIPFSWIYGLIVQIRNFLFNQNIFKSVKFDVHTIGVGNLRVGGTGKTAVIDYLLAHYSQSGMISRGYGRRTKGFRQVNENDHPDAVGDEPLMLKQKYPDHTIVVCENRALGISEMLQNNPILGPILLDDNFQHRWVKTEVQVVLTEWDRPFFNDRLLPAGRLREPKANIRRGDVVLVTKCHDGLSVEQKAQYSSEIPLDDSKIFFSRLSYQEPFLINGNSGQFEEVLAITGIDNPVPFIEYLNGNFKNVEHRQYNDHSTYTEKDMAEWKSICANASKRKVIFTTEKDAVKMKPLLTDQDDISIYVVAISLVIDREKEFLNCLKHGKT